MRSETQSQVESFTVHRNFHTVLCVLWRMFEQLFFFNIIVWHARQWDKPWKSNKALLFNLSIYLRAARHWTGNICGTCKMKKRWSFLYPKISLPNRCLSEDGREPRMSSVVRGGGVGRGGGDWVCSVDPARRWLVRHTTADYRGQIQATTTARAQVSTSTIFKRYYTMLICSLFTIKKCWILIW